MLSSAAPLGVVDTLLSRSIVHMQFCSLPNSKDSARPSIPSAHGQFCPRLPLALFKSWSEPTSSSAEPSTEVTRARAISDRIFHVSVCSSGMSFTHWMADRDRNRKLEELNKWRNAIAHDDFKDRATFPLGRDTILRLSKVERWRSACNRLAFDMDRSMRSYLKQLSGQYPW